MIHCSVILVPYGSGFGVEPERKLVRRVAFCECCDWLLVEVSVCGLIILSEYSSYYNSWCEWSLAFSSLS